MRSRWRFHTPMQRVQRRLQIGGAGVRFLSRNSRARKSLEKQKSPSRHLGASGRAPSREERGPLRHGRVAWLTAFQPITVAGPRPIHTAFPASLACKLKNECKPRARECQCTAKSVATENTATKKMERRFSDSSNWVCAFPPGRAGLPGNPRGGKARSRKCSWNASSLLAATGPCRRESLFSPWSTPGRSGR